MTAYKEVYYKEVRNQQGRLFELAGLTYPDMDFWWFVHAYFKSDVGRLVEHGHPREVNMLGKELLAEFMQKIDYKYQKGEANLSFSADLIGQLLAACRFYYCVDTIALVDKVTPEYIERAYHGWHEIPLVEAARRLYIYYITKKD